MYKNIGYDFVSHYLPSSLSWCFLYIPECWRQLVSFTAQWDWLSLLYELSNQRTLALYCGLEFSDYGWRSIQSLDYTFVVIGIPQDLSLFYINNQIKMKTASSVTTGFFQWASGLAVALIFKQVPEIWVFTAVREHAVTSFNGVTSALVFWNLKQEQSLRLSFVLLCCGSVTHHYLSS